MATALTPAHRSWRVKVFAATWLSYVGYYFCRKPFSAAKSAIGDEAHWDATTLGNIWAGYLIAYSVGQFVASAMGPKLGPRKNVLLGMGVSIVVTIGMGLTLGLPLSSTGLALVMTALVVVNGLAQATGWSGNLGTMAGWFHKHERGRVMGAWSTNFTVGALVSGWVMAWVLGHHTPPLVTGWIKHWGFAGRDFSGPPPWRWCFYTGAIVLGAIWLVFYTLQRNKPEDVGLAPVDDPETITDEAKVQDPPMTGFLGFSRTAWANLLLVSGFYFCAKFLRYAIWSWSAFFLHRTYHLDDSAANLYATVFDLAGIPGVYVTGWISDKLFASRRAEVSLIMVMGMVGATGALMAFGGASVAVFAILLVSVGFTLYGPDALLSGAGAMDIGSRRLATRAAAIISGFGSLGAVLQEVVIGRMYDAKHGDLGPVFQLLFGGAVLAAVFCAALVWRNRRGGNGV